MSAAEGNLITSRDELTKQPMVAGVGWRQWLFILAILAAITITEWIFAYKNVAYGIGLALFLTIGIYILISVMRFSQPITNSAYYQLCRVPVSDSVVYPVYLFPTVVLHKSGVPHSGGVRHHPGVMPVAYLPEEAQFYRLRLQER